MKIGDPVLVVVVVPKSIMHVTWSIEIRHFVSFVIVSRDLTKPLQFSTEYCSCTEV